jgi:predicted GNAT superfamily acetyltransferase
VPKTRIRLIRSHAEFRQCEDLQKTVWGGLSVSSEVMLVTQKYGGVVLGAFAEGRLAGFLYAFLARRNGKTIHWSHMMAVAPGLRDRGLGFEMKLAHRKLALERGIKSVCWTFDPLQSRNATLNLARLGAQAEEYIVDCYGHFPSKIEKGLPSDRLVVNWQIASSRVRRRLQTDPPELLPPNCGRINETESNAKGFLKNHRLHLNLGDRRLAMEIPANTDEMRAGDSLLASKWRLEAREAFQSYLARGYQIESFIPPGAQGRRNAFYVFRRND